MEKTKRARALFSVFSVAILDYFGFAVVFILFAPLILDPEFAIVKESTSLEMRYLILTLLLAAFPAAQFFGAPLFGDIADMYGRKKTFYFTLVGTMFGYALSAMAIYQGSSIFFIISRVLTGFFAGNMSICFATIADVSPDEDSRTKNFSRIIVIIAISWISSMLIGGNIPNTLFGHLFPFLVAIVLALLSLLIIYFFFPETHPKKQKASFSLHAGFLHIATALKTKKIRPYFFILICWILGWGVGVQWYAAYAIKTFEITRAQTSWGLVLTGILWAFGGLVILPLLLKRFPLKKVALIGLLLSALFLSPLVFIPSFSLFAICYGFASIGGTIGYSTTLSLISQNSSKEIQGKTMGLSQSSMAFGWILVPLLGGALPNTFLYPTAALFMLLSSMIVLFARNKV